MEYSSVRLSFGFVWVSYLIHNIIGQTGVDTSFLNSV